MEIASRLDWDRNRWMRRPLNAAVSPVKADADFMSRLMFLLRKVSYPCLHKERLFGFKELPGAQREAAVNSVVEKSFMSRLMFLQRMVRSSLLLLLVCLDGLPSAHDGHCSGC